MTPSSKNLHFKNESLEIQRRRKEGRTVGGNEPEGGMKEDIGSAKEI